MFEFFLWIVYLELWGCFSLQTFRVSRTRQIDARVDGFLQENLTDEIMRRNYLLEFLIVLVVH